MEAAVHSCQSGELQVHLQPHLGVYVEQGKEQRGLESMTGVTYYICDNMIYV